MNTEEKIERVARASHNLIVSYCKLHGDHSIKEWDDAEQWQRDSTVDMVKSTLDGNYSPKGEHDRWLEAKVKKGYVYGAKKNDDPNAGPLTNPNIMPYGDLPLIQRMKDIILISATVGFAAHFDLTVKKMPDFALA